LASLKAGDRVRLSGGFGNFRPRGEPSLCFIASGIGTVPFISILKELHAAGDLRPLLFFLAVTYEDEVPDLDEIRRISGAMPNLNLRLLVYSVDRILYSSEFFRAELSGPLSYSYYICSSPRVRDGVVNSLADLGVAKSAIHYEAFSLG
jgi:predicted ferric reductase